MPAPHKTRTVYWRVRVHRKLRRKEVVKRRITGFTIHMRVRRTDGVWSRPVPLNHKAVLAEPDGKPLAELFLRAGYSPRKGLLRYRLKIKNVGVPKSLYKRAFVTSQAIARYKF